MTSVIRTIANTVFTQWNLMRALRLGIGIAIGIQAFQSQNLLIGMIAAFFLFQSITNTGCCSSNGCNI